MYGEAYLNWLEAKELSDEIVPRLKEIATIIDELEPEVRAEFSKILREKLSITPGSLTPVGESQLDQLLRQQSIFAQQQQRYSPAGSPRGLLGGFLHGLGL